VAAEAADSAEEVASPAAAETDERAPPSEVVLGSVLSLEEVAVAAGESPTAVLGVGTVASPQTPSAAETAASTSSGYQSAFGLSRTTRLRLTPQVFRKQPK
jgi:hypothetical protein